MGYLNHDTGHLRSALIAILRQLGGERLVTHAELGRAAMEDQLDTVQIIGTPVEGGMRFQAQNHLPDSGDKALADWERELLEQEEYKAIKKEQHRKDLAEIVDAVIEEMHQRKKRGLELP